MAKPPPKPPTQRGPASRLYYAPSYTNAAAPAATPLFDAKTELGVLREAVRFAEKCLDAQLTIISALAQRAGSLAAMFGAGATAMLGAELAALAALKMPLNLQAYGVALVAPAIMFAGCTLCGMAASTSTFQTAGNDPSGWCTEADLCGALIGELGNYNGYVRHNDGIISRHARHLRFGLRLGFLSPVTLAVIGACFFYLR
jgi:hypothetical protein